MPLMPNRLVLTALTVALLVAGCSKFNDALVGNPCPVGAEVAFWSGGNAPADPGDWGRFYTVPAQSSRRVPDVFAVGASTQGSVLVRFDGGGEALLHVSIRNADPVPVLLLASSCP